MAKNTIIAIRLSKNEKEKIIKDIQQIGLDNLSAYIRFLHAKFYPLIRKQYNTLSDKDKRKFRDLINNGNLEIAWWIEIFDQFLVKKRD